MVKNVVNLPGQPYFVHPELNDLSAVLSDINPNELIPCSLDLEVGLAHLRCHMFPRKIFAPLERSF